jgi:hypothetical protein
VIPGPYQRERDGNHTMAYTGDKRQPENGEEGKQRLSDSVSKAKKDPGKICQLVKDSVSTENILFVPHLTDYVEIGISGHSEYYKNPSSKYMEVPLSGKCCIFLLMGAFAVSGETDWIGGSKDDEFVGYDVVDSSVLYINGCSAVTVTEITE